MRKFLLGDIGIDTLLVVVCFYLHFGLAHVSGLEICVKVDIENGIHLSFFLFAKRKGEHWEGEALVWRDTRVFQFILKRGTA